MKRKKIVDLFSEYEIIFDSLKKSLPVILILIVVFITFNGDSNTDKIKEDARIIARTTLSKIVLDEVYMQLVLGKKDTTGLQVLKVAFAQSIHSNSLFTKKIDSLVHLLDNKEISEAQLLKISNTLKQINTEVLKTRLSKN